MKRIKLFVVLVALFSFFSLGFKTLNAELPETVEVKVEYILIGEEYSIQAGTTMSKQYGSLVEVNVSILEIDGNNYEFAYWIVNGAIRKSLGNPAKIRVQTKTHLIAVLKPMDSVAVVYVDTNGQLINYEKLSHGGEPAEQTKDVYGNNISDTYTKPGATQVGFDVPQTVSEDSVFVLEYNEVGPGGELTVNGNLDEKFYDLNDVATITASDQNFKYWVDENGQILSKNRNYSFTMLGIDRVINSVIEGEEPAEHIVNMTQDLGLRADEEKRTFVGQFNGSPIEFGFLISESGEEIEGYDKDNDDVIVAQSSVMNAETKEFMMSFPNSIKSVRAYAVYDREVVLSGYSYEETILIYEAYGAGGNAGATYTHDYVVLYNTTNNDIDLTGYSLQYAAKEGEFNYILELMGTIEAKGYYLIQMLGGNNGVPIPLQPNITGTQNMSGTEFKLALANTLDKVESSNDDNVVDFLGVGEANDYKGTGTAPKISAVKSAKRESFFNANNNEKDFKAVTPDLEYLLSEDLKDVIADKNELSLPETYEVDDPVLVLPTSGSRGTTIIWMSSDNVIIDPSTGIVTHPEELTNVTLTAKVSKGVEEATREFVIMVYPEDGEIDFSGIYETMFSVVGNGANIDDNVFEINPENIFTLTNEKNSASGPAKYYSDGTAARFYGHASGSGSSVEITLDEEYKIVSVEFIYPSNGQTAGNVTITSGSITLLDNVSKPENVIYNFAEHSGVNYNKFEIKNTTLGATTQFRLEQIKITIEQTTDEDKLAAAKTALEIEYESGDSISYVTNNLTLPIEGLHDTTVSWSSDKPNVISNIGVVNRPAGEEDVIVTLTATITLGSLEETKPFVLTVKAEGAALPEPQTYIETFENVEGIPKGTNYGDAQFNGDGGSVWELKHVKDETGQGEDIYAIDDSGVMLRRASDSYIEITLPKGLKKFSFDYRKAYTATTGRKLEIYINDVLKHTTDTFGSGSGVQETVYNVNLENLNYIGEVVVRIKIEGTVTTNKQVTIDNVSWTENFN